MRSAALHSQSAKLAFIFVFISFPHIFFTYFPGLH